MKYILILPLLLALYGKYNAQDSISYIEYMLPVTFDSLYLPGDLYFMFEDKNIVKSSKDSTIINNIGIDKSNYEYKLTFKNAKINTVEKCSYTLHIKKDTLKSVSVKIYDVRNLNQLIFELKDEFGEPFINVEDKEKKYEWRRLDMKVLPILTVNKNQKEGELIISLK